jgi:hypothetical protein
MMNEEVVVNVLITRMLIKARNNILHERVRRVLFLDVDYWAPVRHEKGIP